MSVDTAFPRQLPAASGPAMSIDSGGKSSRRPILKLKSSFLGAPTKSLKASASEGTAMPTAACCKDSRHCRCGYGRFACHLEGYLVLIKNTCGCLALREAAKKWIHP